MIGAVFFPVLSADFLYWDDRTHLHENPWLWPPEQRSWWQFWIEPYWGLYVPVAYNFWGLVATFATSVDSAGMPTLLPGPFHAASLALHGVVVMLVYWGLRRWGQRQEVAFLGASLFAIHPLQVESVAWISETRGLLAAALAFAAMFLYVAAVESDSPQQRASAGPRLFWTRYLGATALFIGAILAKPSAVALPLMILVLIVSRAQGKLFQHARWLLPWIVIAGLDAVAMKYLQPAEAIAATSSLGHRVWIAIDSLTFYVLKFVAPWPLSIDYGRRPDVALTSSAVVSSVLVVASLIVAGLLLRPRQVWWTGMALFAAGLAPVLGMIPFEFQSISTVADRYAYLAMFGPVLILTSLLSRRDTLTPIVRCGVWCWLGALAIVSTVQVRYWHDDVTLYRHALSINPHSVVALANLGYLHQQREEFDLANQFYRQTLAAAPHEVIALKGLGEIAMNGGDFTTAADWFAKATQAQPNDAAAWNNWGVSLAAQGSFPQAELHFRRAIALASRPNAEFHVNLARTLLELKRIPDAHAEVNRALSIDPGSESARELRRALGP